MTSVPPPGNRPTPDGSWSYRPSSRDRDRGRTGSPPALDPLSRRLLQAAGGLSALLIALVAFAWLHGSDEAALNPIAQAATHTQRQPGSRIAIRGIYGIGASDQRLVMHGTGAYNGRTTRSRQTMAMDVPGSAAQLHVEAVGDKRMVYMRSKLFSAGLPPGDRWLAFGVGLGRSAETAMAGSTDSQGQLEMLEAASGDVEQIGEEELRGVETKRYRGSIDLNRYADSLRNEGKPTAAGEYEQLASLMPTPIPVEAWLDDAGLLRRMRMVMDVPSDPGAAPVKMDLTLEFFDFGIAPKVKLPDPSEVFDSTPLARADLHILDGSAIGVPARVASGAPLSAVAFRGRANAICENLEAQAKRLKEVGAPLGVRLRALVARGRNGTGDPGEMRRAFAEYGRRVYEPAVALSKRALRRIAALSPPDALRPDVQRFLHFNSISVEVGLAQARALEVGSVKTLEELKGQLKTAGHTAKRAAIQAGLRTCAKE